MKVRTIAMVVFGTTIAMIAAPASTVGNASSAAAATPAVAQHHFAFPVRTKPAIARIGAHRHGKYLLDLPASPKTSLSVAAANKPTSLMGWNRAALTSLGHAAVGHKKHRGVSRPDDTVGASFTSLYSADVDGGYVTGGTGMADLGRGTINIEGIPSGSTVVKAYLLWDVLDNSDESADGDGNFDGTAITGSLAGSDDGPNMGVCVEVTNDNYSFDADVTDMVSGNGSYPLTGFASSRTDGADPWRIYPAISGPIILGASLVVVFENSDAPSAHVAIYAGATAEPDTTSGTTLHATFSGFTVSNSEADTTFIVGSGSAPPGISPSDADAPAEYGGSTLSPGYFIGWDPMAAGRYEGGSLWDTDTYRVGSILSDGDTSAAVSMGGGESCQVWVGQVLSIGSQYQPPTAPPVFPGPPHHSGPPPSHKGHCGCGVAEPVDPATGDYYDGATDVTVPGAGIDMSFKRYYDAAAAQDDETAASSPGPLGYGWSDNLNLSVSEDTSSGSATLNDDGGSTTFDYLADATVTLADMAEQEYYEIAEGGTEPSWCPSDAGGAIWCPAAPRYKATLTKSGSTWTYVDVTGSPITYTFSGDTSASLSAIADATGDTLTAGTYDPGSGQAACPSGDSCTAWSSTPDGDSEPVDALVEALNGSDQLAKVFGADDGDPSATFSYSGSGCSSWTSPLPEDLCTATDPGTGTTTFAYDTTEDSPYQYDVTSEDPPSGSEVSNEYNDDGTVSEQTLTTGSNTEVFEFSYYSDCGDSCFSGSPPGTSMTQVTTYPDGTSGSDPVSYSTQYAEIDNIVFGTIDDTSGVESWGQAPTSGVRGREVRLPASTSS